MDKGGYFAILKQMHDIFRDPPAPICTGMDAYNEIINYLYLRHLSDNTPIEQLKIKYNLRTMYEEYCTDEKIKEDEKNYAFNQGTYSGIRKELHYAKLSEVFLPRIGNNSDNKKVGFVKIMGDSLAELKVDLGRATMLVHQVEGTNISDGGRKAQKIINKLFQDGFLPIVDGKFNLELFPYDALGEGFEQFMRDAGSTGGNWGQYFTNIQVVDWISEHVELKRGEKVIDPFGGSGGFILRAKKKYNLKKSDIFAREFDDKIFKFLKFNSKIAGLNTQNIQKGDSFDFPSHLKHSENLYDKVITNPPYGMSVNIPLSADSEAKNYWGPMKTVNSTIKDSMGLSLYSIYKCLKIGGIAGVVSERGVMGNGSETKSWQKRLRQFLVENADIKEILLLPKGIFAHTNFDTCCIIFEKGKITEKIVFHQGFFKDEDKGRSNKKMYVNENVLSITFEDIVNADWSLKYEDYVKTDEGLVEGIVYKNISELFNIHKSKRKAGEAIDDGEYTFLTSSPVVKKSKSYDFDGEYIVIGSGGAGSCHYMNGKFGCSSHNFVLEMNCDMSLTYAFVAMKLNFPNIQKLYTGTGLKNLSTTSLSKIKIPMLPQEHQKEIVEFIKKTFGEDYDFLDNIVKKFEGYDLFNMMIRRGYEDFEDLIVVYNDIVNAEGMFERYKTTYKTLLMRNCFRGYKGDKKKLGDIIETKRGKQLSKKSIQESIGEYPVIGGGIKPYGFYSEFNTDEHTILISQSGANAGYTSRYDVKVWASDCFRVYPSVSIDRSFLYEYLRINNTKFTKPKIKGGLQSGNAQPHVYEKDIKRLWIIVPPIEAQKEIVRKIEEIEKDDSPYNIELTTIQKTIGNLFRCAEELILNDSQTINTTDDLDDLYDSQEHEDLDIYDEPEEKTKSIKGKESADEPKDKSKNKSKAKYKSKKGKEREES